MTVAESGVDFFHADPVDPPQARDPAKAWGSATSSSASQATTLSGGEAQRVKLAKELSKRRATGRHTCIILDEPTTGPTLRGCSPNCSRSCTRWSSKGNTVVVIEHNLEVIKTADWILDLGPEGGDGGGEIVAAGTPEDIAAAKRSYTGQFLKPVLIRKPPKTEAAE